MTHATATPVINTMTPAHQAAVSYLARYTGTTHALYRYGLARWFSWAEAQGLDPLIGVQRAHVELYVRHLSDAGLVGSTVRTETAPVRGFFKFAHIDGVIPSDPAQYARLPRAQRDESRIVGLTRHELARYIAVAPTISVQHGALAQLLGVLALRSTEAANVRIEDYSETVRGHRVLRLIGKGDKPATIPIPVPVLRALDDCAGDRTEGRLLLRPLSGRPIDRGDVAKMSQRICREAGLRPVRGHALRRSAITCALDAGVSLRKVQRLARHSDPRTTERYDLARHNLDDHGVHVLAAYVSGS